MLISQDLVSTLNIPVSMALGVAPRWVRKNSSCPAVSGMRMTLTCLQSVLLAHPVTPPRVTMASPDLVYSLKLDNLVSMALEVAPRWPSCPAVFLKWADLDKLVECSVDSHVVLGLVPQQVGQVPVALVNVVAVVPLVPIGQLFATLPSLTFLLLRSFTL